MPSQEDIHTLLMLWPKISETLPDDLAVLSRKMNELEIISAFVEASGRRITRIPMLGPDKKLSPLLVAAIRNVLAERRRR